MYLFALIQMGLYLKSTVNYRRTVCIHVFTIMLCFTYRNTMHDNRTRNFVKIYRVFNYRVSRRNKGCYFTFGLRSSSLVVWPLSHYHYFWLPIKQSGRWEKRLWLLFYKRFLFSLTQISTFKWTTIIYTVKVLLKMFVTVDIYDTYSGIILNYITFIHSLPSD